MGQASARPSPVDPPLSRCGKRCKPDARLLHLCYINHAIMVNGAVLARNQFVRGMEFARLGFKKEVSLNSTEFVTALLMGEV